MDPDGIKSGLFRLIGFDVEFSGSDSRGRYAIPSATGLTLLYGKNGSGKTSTLRAISRALRGVSQPANEPLGIAILELDDWQDFNDLRFKWERDLIQQIVDSVIADDVGDWDFDDYSSEFMRWSQSLRHPIRVTEDWFRPHAASRSEITGKSLRQLMTVLLVQRLIYWHSFGGSSDKPVRTSVAEFLIDVVERPTVALIPIGTPDRPRWKVRLVARREERNSVIERGISHYESQIQAWCEGLSSEADLKWHSELSAWESGELDNPLLMETDKGLMNGRFVEIDSGDINISEPIFHVVDTDHLQSPDGYVNKLLQHEIENWEDVLSLDSRSLDVLSDGHAVEDEGEAVVSSNSPMADDSPFKNVDLVTTVFGMSQVEQALRQSLPFIRKSGLGIQGLQVFVASALRDLANGQFLRIGYEMAGIASHVGLLSIDELSEAQRRSVELFFSIELGRTTDTRQVFLVGDEADRSMHALAINDLYSSLRLCEISGVLSSHSIESLGAGRGRRIHLAQCDDGSINASTFDVKELHSQAKVLGVRPSSLVGMIQLFLLVEGEHDRIVFESLLGSQGIEVGLEVLVVPVRGAGNAVRTLDTKFLDYSDAPVLVVFDNVRAKHGHHLLSRAKDAWSRTADRRRVASEISLSSKERLSFEEVLMRELILQSSEVGLLSRIEVFGLSKGDIIEYLDPNSFGLDGSWLDLRNEFAVWRTGTPKSRSDFKSFLVAEKRGQISIEKVRVASSDLDHLDHDLVELTGVISSLLEMGKFSREIGL